VVDRVDRDAGLAHLALGPGVVRVQPHLRRQVERDGEPRLPVVEQVSEPLVGLLGRGHPGVLPHRPQAPEVHRRVHTAGERRLAGESEVPFGVEAAEIGRLVHGLEVDPGVRRPAFDVAHRRSSVAGSIGTVDIVDPRVEDYMRSLLTRYDEPVLLEMEAEGKERNFPIIGRLVGVTVELLARSIGARRVVELGSGFGYSAYWFSRAVGPGDAVENLGAVDGEIDVVYNDIDKVGYPNAWRAARERIRVGGLYLCDNVLWSGAVADPAGDHGRDAKTTNAILEHNRMIADDERFASSIVPTRDGVFVALRVA